MPQWLTENWIYLLLAAVAIFWPQTKDIVQKIIDLLKNGGLKKADSLPGGDAKEGIDDTVYLELIDVIARARRALLHRGVQPKVVEVMLRPLVESACGLDHILPPPAASQGAKT